MKNNYYIYLVLIIKDNSVRSKNNWKTANEITRTIELFTAENNTDDVRNERYELIYKTLIKITKKFKIKKDAYFK